MNYNLITGEKRPLVGWQYQYRLKINCSAVRWEVRDVFKVLMSNDNGRFTFTNDALGKEFTVYAHYKESAGQMLEKTALMVVKPVPGSPKVIKVSWLDANFESVSGTVKYLDDIHLSIQTANIPPGDLLEVRIWEKESIFYDDRSPGTLYAEVNEKGFAILKVSAELLKNYAEKLNGLDWINDSVHHYYAEITYYGAAIPDEKATYIGPPGSKPPVITPKLKITDKSEILDIENMADRTVPPRNGQKPAVVLDDKLSDVELKPVKLKFHVYFDGTMGNKFNVELYNNPNNGKKYIVFIPGAGYYEVDGETVIKMYGQGDAGTSSYKQDYTSITDLFELDEAVSKQKIIKIYIEGVGSIPYGEDDVVVGAGLGWNTYGTGIKAKVQKALGEILREAKKVVNSQREYVNKDEVSVFGFSRGATTARFFTSKREDIALNTQVNSLVKPEAIFKFVGLFDTVSSVTDGRDDVKTFKLAMAGRALQVLHLTAGNEFRKNFSLTDIHSSINAGVGYELKLPGNHSDIGGGYKVETTETVEDEPGFVDRLIAEGWHLEKDRVETTKSVYYYGGSFSPGSYHTFTYNKVARTIYNRYRYIPLAIMIKFAEVFGPVVYDNDLQREAYAVKSRKLEKDSLETEEMVDALDAIGKQLFNFAIANYGAHRKSAMQEVEGQQLKDLRHSYLHLSSSREGGHYTFTDKVAHTGRYDDAGNPDREIIPG